MNVQKPQPSRILKPDLDPWRMIRWGGGNDSRGHLLVPGLRGRGRHPDYLMVACGKAWNLRAIHSLDPLGPYDERCEACLASREAQALEMQHD